VGFAAAIEAKTDWSRVQTLRDRLEAGVRACRSDALIVAEGAPRLPNTACLLVPGVPAETQLMALDLAGISVSSGAACSSGKVGSSHVLAAMGLPPEMARCAIRVSLGWSSTEADVDAFLAACRGIYTRPRASVA
jgi:cysteine desulfurase